jgi:hypothetical protein
MKKLNNVKTGNEFDYYSKEILNEDKPLNLSTEKNKSNNLLKYMTPTPVKNFISTNKNTEKKMSNTDFNNLRFEAEPLENKKLLRKSSTTNSMDMRGSFNNNNLNNISELKSNANNVKDTRTSFTNNNINNISELKNTANNLNSITNNYQSSELEQFSPIKSTQRTPDKGN